jgi:glucokinase
VILAVDIGGTQFSLMLVREDGSVAEVRRYPTDRDGGAAWMVDQVVTRGRLLMDRAKGRVRACGVGFGGPVDFEGQRVIQSTHVPGWRNYPISRALSGALGVPVTTDNDANAGALGELMHGAGKGCRDLLYYTVSTGIGGGIIIDGRLHRGANGNAGEVGHVPVAVDGPPCACGNRGCLEALCSGPAIARRAVEALRRAPGRGKRLRKELRSGGPLTARQVFDCARQGDELATAVVKETALYLSMGVAAAINTLAPEAVVVGGGVAKAGRILFTPLRRFVSERLMPVHRGCVRIVPARLRNRSVLMGAAVLAVADRDFL